MTPEQRRHISELAAEARAERIQFVEDQLSYGFSPDMIAADLGIKMTAVERAMYRAGRLDLARRFTTPRTRNPRRHFSHGNTCEHCGDPRANNSAKWCRRCWDSVGAAA